MSAPARHKRTDRLIDRKRNSGGSFTLGGEGETTRATVATADVLYSVTEKAIYSIKLADQIDPERTNLDLPIAIQQKVLGYGSDAQLVARTFMTAGVLFDATYLGQGFQKDAGLGLALELARRLAVLQQTLDALVQNERRVVAELDQATRGNSLRVPETPDLRAKVEAFLASAHRIQETLFGIAFLFYPAPTARKGTRDHLLQQVALRAPNRADYHVAMTQIVEFLHKVREHRNASVHEDGPKALLLRDFHVLPNGQFSAPIMEIRHPEFGQPEKPVTFYMDEVIGMLIEASEAMIAWLCAENIQLKGGPYFRHALAALPEGETRSGSRYCYHSELLRPLSGPPERRF